MLVCVWLWVQVLKISCIKSSSEDINTQRNNLLYADAVIMCGGNADGPSDGLNGTTDCDLTWRSSFRSCRRDLSTRLQA